MTDQSSFEPRNGQRFNPPPGWPEAPADWTPPPGWTPDPSWPPAPAGWQMWVPAANGGRRWIARHKILTAVGAVLMVCIVGSAVGGALGDSKNAASSKPIGSGAATTPTTSIATTSAAAASRAAAAAAARSASSSKAAASRAAATRAAAASRAAAAASSAASSKAAASRAAAASSAAAQPPAPAPTAADCTPGYSPCIPPGPDVDCAGGSGNGPRYVQGPVAVTGSDPYGLDGNHDGVGCES